MTKPTVSIGHILSEWGKMMHLWIKTGIDGNDGLNRQKIGKRIGSFPSVIIVSIFKEYL